MGQSKPPRSNIDLTNSYARRRDDRVELVLVRPAVTMTRRIPGLELSCEGVVVAAEVQVEAKPVRRLVAHVDRSALHDGTWRLTLRPGPGPVVLGARLLVQGDRPLVLLMGSQASRSYLPRPRPRPRPRKRPQPAPAPPPPGRWDRLRSGVVRRLAPADRSTRD